MGRSRADSRTGACRWRCIGLAKTPPLETYHRIAARALRAAGERIWTIGALASSSGTEIALAAVKNRKKTIMKLPIAPFFPPMEAVSVDEPPAGDHWQYEPKWDGFRCLAFRDGGEVFLQSKSGQPLARYFPDLVDA